MSKQRGRPFEATFEVPTQLPTPTRCVPGSDEKIEELRQRYAAGVLLHHPEDATLRECKPYERVFKVLF